jgi:hypothetical protein
VWGFSDPGGRKTGVTCGDASIGLPTQPAWSQQVHQADLPRWTSCSESPAVAMEDFYLLRVPEHRVFGGLSRTRRDANLLESTLRLHPKLITARSGAATQRTSSVPACIPARGRLASK